MEKKTMGEFVLGLNFTTLASGRPTKNTLRYGLTLLPDEVLDGLAAAVDRERFLRKALPPIEEIVSSIPEADEAAMRRAGMNVDAVKELRPELFLVPNQEEAAMWRSGDRIEAIKMLRGRVRCGLKEAKDALENALDRR